MKGRENQYAYNAKIGPVSSYCVFVDILGYSNEVVFSHKVGKEKEHFENFYKSLLSVINDFSNLPSIQIKVFSDNILLGVPLNYLELDDEHQLGLLTVFLADLQFKLTIEGFFIRGGWTIGQLFVDENIAYGEGLISAYNLEQTTKFPRIEVGGDIEEIFNKHFSYGCDSYQSIQNTYFIKNNNCIIVNYLFCITQFEELKLHLKLHKELIEKRLNDHLSNQTIHSKFEWCADYHNYFIEEFLSDDYYNYKISNKNYNPFTRIITQ